jgi:hypothetical protein
MPLLLLAGAAIAAQAPNTLSSEEKKDGWRLLFDGRTLTGWRGFHRTEPSPGWAVADGAIRKVPAQGELGQAGGDLITVDQFENFEFQIEWKLARGGNSGIKYLVSEELPKTGYSAVSYEYQVLDDDHHPDAKQGIAGNRTAGALYDLIAPNASKRARAAGEWNQTRIVKRGTHIEHWLNGVKVVEFEQGGADLKSRIAGSKFKDTAGFGAARRGHILLQDHGDEVFYRNIKIREVK